MERSLGLADDLALFAAAARHGGLSAASRAVGVPKSRLSRRILDLEARLGARLVERSSRRFAVTEFGRQVLGHAEEIAAHAAAAAELAAAHLTEPQGLVRIAAPINAEGGVYAALAPTLAAYPALRVQILLENRPVDLIAERIDIALRVRPELEGEADFQVRPLARKRSQLFAAPALAARLEGAGPEALAELPTLARTAQPETRWRLEHAATGEVRELVVRPRLSAGSFEPLREAAVAGLGVVLMPEELCRRELAEGVLAPALPEWREPEQRLYLVHVSRRALLRGVRVTIDALVAALAEPSPQAARASSAG